MSVPLCPACRQPLPPPPQPCGDCGHDRPLHDITTKKMRCSYGGPQGACKCRGYRLAEVASAGT